MASFALSAAARRAIATRAFSVASGAAKEFKTVGVVGLGLMGHGIAQVTAASPAGYKVIAVEHTPDAATAGLERIRKSVTQLTHKAVAKGSLTKDAGEAHIAKTMGAIEVHTDVGALSSADLVIEAAPEDLGFKQRLYERLKGVVGPGSVVASNTSGLLIDTLAGYFGDKSRIIGLHYFNPVQLMALCEVIKTPHTPQSTVDAAMSFVRSQGKTPVLAADAPGFIVNRLLVPYLAQAIALVDRGVASVGDVDTAMKLGCGHPMGPLHLADYVGLDTTLYILQNWTKLYPNEPAFFIPDSLKRLVAAGKLGRKSGQGYYTWQGDKVVAPAPSHA